MAANWGFWEVLIGVVTISLAVLSIFIGLFGVWLYFKIEEIIENIVAKALEDKTKELRGRMYGFVGLILGHLSTVRPEFIHDAIKFSRDAYEAIPEFSPFKVTAMNNLCFYLAQRGYMTDADAAVKYAKAALDDYAKSGEVEWITTYARVVARYANSFDHPRQTLLAAEKMMEELIANDQIPPKNKADAARHLTDIRAALGAMGGA